MIFVLIPYFNNDSDVFAESLKRQTVPFRVLRRDRKADGIYWTRAMNDFVKTISMFRGVKDDDVVCILNNDLELSPDLFEVGSHVKSGEVMIPVTIEDGHPIEWGINVGWKHKAFVSSGNTALETNCFSPRGTFMTVGDFKRAKYFWMLPHYLADYDFAIRAIKNGLKPIRVKTWVKHQPHEKDVRAFSSTSTVNPLFWTIFLLRNCPLKYLPINLLKAWVTPFLKKQ